MIPKRKRVDLALRIWAILILSGFSVFSGVMLCQIAVILHKTNLARDWVSSPASVSKFQRLVSTTSKSGSSKFEIEYTYSFNGKEFRGNVFDYNQLLLGWTRKEAVVMGNQYRVGKTIRIYLNPDTPSESVVQRDMRPRLIWPFMFGMVFIFSPFLAYKYL